MSLEQKSGKWIGQTTWTRSGTVLYPVSGHIVPSEQPRPARMHEDCIVNCNFLIYIWFQSLGEFFARSKSLGKLHLSLDSQSMAQICIDMHRASEGPPESSRKSSGKVSVRSMCVYLQRQAAKGFWPFVVLLTHQVVVRYLEVLSLKLIGAHFYWTDSENHSESSLLSGQHDNSKSIIRQSPGR